MYYLIDGTRLKRDKEGKIISAPTNEELRAIDKSHCLSISADILQRVCQDAINNGIITVDIPANTDSQRSLKEKKAILNAIENDFGTSDIEFEE